MVRNARSDALPLCTLFPNHSGNAQGVRHKQPLHFSTASHLRRDGSKPSRNSRLNISERTIRKAVFGPTKRSIEKGVAERIVEGTKLPW